MRNSEVARAMCEQHSKDVIFAAAIQAISIAVAGYEQPNFFHMNYAMELMQHVLDINGLEIARVIANDITKA